MYRKHTLLLSFVIFSCSALLSGCNRNTNTPSISTLPTEVSYINLVNENIPVITSLVGRVEAERVSEVRPRVDGIILQRFFEEGADIKKGQILYQIDPTPYEATVKKLKAELAKEQANEEMLRLQDERFKYILSKHLISKQDYDKNHSAWQQAKAAVMAAKAALDEAEINLGYTNVRAPISGKIGRSNITEGALVTANQTAALASIQQLDHVYINVNQSSTDLINLENAVSKGKITNLSSTGNNVKISLMNDTDYPHLGSIKFSDISVDQDTGMVLVRVTVPNPEHKLLPGMFVKASIKEGSLKDSFLIPQKAIQRTPRGEAFVMTLTKDNHVAIKNVSLGKMIGSNWTVTSGLSSIDKVIVEGIQKINPGDLVKPYLYN
ncbi:TPA: efflux RND transporter periplasmic adaptor subunit [Aeromonas veronii]|uniref:efflux RND transporter periplasmic adaptor subunit n=1 Tax=uncultured Aeromonas sp. TaxID=263763 RepID=UPI00259900F9|nr:efflux RND transporter periplasmic adaptor subunit [uncultured Aeromonas sp.]